MPLVNNSYDFLPHVDTAPDNNDLASAQAVIDADIKSAGVDTTLLHPALIPASSYTPSYSAAIEEEHTRLQDDLNSKLSAVDLQRYEDLEAPANTNPTSDKEKHVLLAQYREALRKAYTSSEYVNARSVELGLLEKYGKNAWLVGNSQLEDILKAIETELAQIRTQQEEVEEMRRTQQAAVQGEIKTLEDTWKRGIGRVLETEVAAEGLRQQIMEKRRAGATEE